MFDGRHVRKHSNPHLIAPGSPGKGSIDRDHMDVVTFTPEKIIQRRDSIRSGYRIQREAPMMRHFTDELEPVKRN